MNQTCKVCGEPAAGFHFGAFTCEGCKSFFGRSYNNLSSISECKNNGNCVIDKKNRTTCKACRLRKCYSVGMSKGGSRYGRRSNWFKIHCLLQEQQQQAVEAAGKAASGAGCSPGSAAAHGHGAFGDMAAAAAAAAAAQQHMQQRNPHMPQSMGGLLGYPSYLPEMAGSPFARHPADAAAAAALPFFNMMNSLPNISSPQSAFQLPPHLLFPSYHPGAAAAAAADAAYRNEMYKHRQSVDSAASGDSMHYTQSHTPSSQCTNLTVKEDERLPTPDRQSPVDVCVADDDEEQHSTVSHRFNSVSPVSSTHTVHNPIPIRATPQSLTHSPLHSAASHTTSISQTHTPEPTVAASPMLTNESISFAAKMESLSPVSVCSISAETTAMPAPDQDCPMDLSMKTTRSSVQSCNTSRGECDVHSDSSSSDELVTRQDGRRKFYQLHAESEASSLSLSSSTTSSSDANEAVKRQKLAMNEASSYGGASHAFAAAHNANAMRGIFVCV